MDPLYGAARDALSITHWRMLIAEQARESRAKGVALRSMTLRYTTPMLAAATLLVLSNALHTPALLALGLVALLLACWDLEHS